MLRRAPPNSPLQCPRRVRHRCARLFFCLYSLSLVSQMSVSGFICTASFFSVAKGLFCCSATSVLLISGWPVLR